MRSTCYLAQDEAGAWRFQGAPVEARTAIISWLAPTLG